ncbi:MAG: metallophosphoesterase [Oligoflexia bacterium]|nr:metallophosphoesterase [Oligoflexia bacterium]
MTSRIKLVISDFHLSRGKWLRDGARNPLEDFHQDERFQEFLDFYSTGEYAETEVELIVNGDFFDPLAVVPLGERNKNDEALEYPLEVVESAAVTKIRTICAGHPLSLEAMKQFLGRGKRIIMRWGNHDAAILWPKVQEELRELLSPPRPEQLEFQQKPYVFDRICIDHGHQFEALNAFDEENLYVDQKTRHGVKRIQALPFGSFFVLGYLNRIKRRRNFINQVHPFRNYMRLSLLLDPVFFFTNGLQALWFFFKMRLITHPRRFANFRKTLLLMAEAFHRPSLERIAEELLTGPGSESLDFDTLILGHNHQAATRLFPGGRQYINTGTWIPITSLDMATLGHRILRSYALIEYLDGKPRCSLKIWNGRPRIMDDFA